MGKVLKNLRKITEGNWLSINHRFTFHEDFLEILEIFITCKLFTHAKFLAAVVTIVEINQS